MSCQRCGGVLAAELADAMHKLVCEMVAIEGRLCHCDDIEDPLQGKLPRAGEALSPERRLQPLNLQRDHNH